MFRKFMGYLAAALCCFPAVAIAASDNPKELDRLLAKVRSKPMIFVSATGEPNGCGRGWRDRRAASGPPCWACSTAPPLAAGGRRCGLRSGLWRPLCGSCRPVLFHSFE